ncbi:Coenzyme F420 hydrogenase/dehydrogenase, beta subunit C-terminal domain [uncultured Vagococcus sp.]|uniref:Coenzyme F420 hydrogenase/dehydrogenase, beta subunit C-terminal domain n=1 Tax=uncultured Vagococcus sp. TaxID=189676 RepID=UPI0028D37217|nr:Coenzyme F420 hydrogenase/dehydrogenase, beta subunit C-terminal domain [uncultured Vagococcus sp.]
MVKSRLKETVVNQGFCVGCGVCAVECPLKVTMKINQLGMIQADIDENKLTDDEEKSISKVCPFSDDSENETVLGGKIFGSNDSLKYHENTGYYLNSYAGYVKSGEYREKGSSGGMGTWLSSKLLESRMVDHVIHVKEKNENPNELFSYQITSNCIELRSGAKSKYYPIEMSEVLRFVEQNPGNYALVGIPCFIKGFRLISNENPILKESIKYTIGLVCGHLKSTLFAQSIGWELGIEPSKLKKIDFRNKLEGRKSSDYAVEVEGDNRIERARIKTLISTDWGHGLFKYKACDYCDDVLAELSDITIGDAWLPRYENDSEGTNLIIVRNQEIQDLLDKNQSEIFIEELSMDEVYQSQAGGFRHKKEGLMHRLYLEDQKGSWRPQKRVKAKYESNNSRRKTYEIRIKLREFSYKYFLEALSAENFSFFSNKIIILIDQCNKIARGNMVNRIIRKIKSSLG